VYQNPVKNGVALKIEPDPQAAGRVPDPNGKFSKARFTVIGEELIEKDVKPGGNAGRVYLPLHWVGKLVKIIRVD
jgi:putative transposon-encoded protein